MRNSHTLFDDQAEDYARYRPKYPKEIFDEIFEYAGTTAGRALAVDVATGSGQAAVDLANFFDQVLAIDPSKGQLENAIQHPKVEYRESPAEAMNIDDHVADLITVAQAVHWFDLPSFWRESHRVLKPNAILAVWGSSLPQVHLNDAATQLIRDFAYDSKYLGDIWDKRALRIENQYADVIPDEALFQNVHRVTTIADLQETKFLTLVGILRSWSTYAAYRKLYPDRKDPLLEFIPQLRAACGVQSDEDGVVMKHCLFLILAKATADS